MDARPAKNRTRTAGFVTVVLVSFLSLEVSILAGRALAAWEPTLSDMLMRWRYHLISNTGARVHRDICIIGIDSRTQDILGRFGAGQWITRAPYVSQISFVDNYLSPGVLAYDIIFEDTLGSAARDIANVTGAPEKIRGLAQVLARIAEDPGEIVPMRQLNDMNKLAAEQGNRLIAHTFATLNARKNLRPILGYYFIGGWVAPQPFAARGWTADDVCGSDPGGNENTGKRVPYLKDVAIPDRDIHFSGEAARLGYQYCLNAKLPTRELLDYCNLGYLNCPRDTDGVVRRIPLVVGFKYVNPFKRETKTVFVPSFALLASLIHLGAELPLKENTVQVFFGKELVINTPRAPNLRIPIDEKGCLYLNFDIKTEDFTDFNSANFLDAIMLSTAGEKEDRRQAARVNRVRQKLNGKIAIVGVTSAGTDEGASPLLSRTPLVYMHLQTINNILKQSFLRPVSAKEENILFAVLFFLFTAICVVEKGPRLGPTAFFSFILYLAGVFTCVYRNIVVLPIITPAIYMGLCAFSVITYRFLTEERAKRLIRGMFSTMVSDKVLAFLESNPGSFSLKGHNAEVTIMFSDVAGFTTISERLPPEKVTALLNAYFTPVTNCIIGSGGYLDKYIGDGIMAVWGVPFADKEHALKACQSALEQQKLIAGLRPVWLEEFGADLKVRMGISSGLATAGNMGSDKKLQYTVTGDIVNFASRLEPVNKDFGTNIIISQATRDLAGDGVVARKLGKIVVLGKTEAVMIYELVGEKGRVPPEKLQVIALYEEALARFLGREWSKALSLLDRIAVLASDVPSRQLAEQIRQFMKDPPPDTWNGEYVRTTKN